MIIFFDGPDGSKKTTLIEAISEAIGFPVWERGPYLPHHHGLKYNTVDSMWYVLDDMKTIELLDKCGCNVLVDRHPVISEIVYREEEDKKSWLSKWKFPKGNGKLTAVIFLLYDQTDDESIKVWEHYCDVVETAASNPRSFVSRAVSTHDPVEALANIMAELEFLL